MRARLLFLFFCLSSSSLAYAVDVSTATGNSITYDNTTGVAIIEGDAFIETSSGTMKADRIEMNTRTNEGHAIGNVEIHEASGTLTAEEAYYNWETSTGTVHDAEGVSPPWRFHARDMRQVAPGIFELGPGDLTSCDEDPPHYVVRYNRGRMIAGKRATVKHARMVPDQTPIFYLPFYSRSLIPHKYSLRIEPGNSGRDGFILKSVLGYPITPNTYTKFKWDWFERTGNGFGVEHRYFLPAIQGTFDSYYVEDNNPDPQPESRRWTLLWNHYQKLLPRLTLNSKLDFKSDQTFGNQFSGSGNQVYVENSLRGLLSEAGLNYQFPKASLQAQVNRQDRFDSTVSSKSFVGKLTLPSLTLNTIPLNFKRVPFYTSFSASFVNETQNRLTPEQTLRYQKSATTGVQIKQDVRISSWTFTPGLGYLETWQDRDVSTTSESDVYTGRYNAKLDVRRRILRVVDLTLSQNHVSRLEENGWQQDVKANDHGIETELLSLSMLGRVGRDTRLTLRSGYDFREPPRNFSNKYKHASARYVSPSMDLQCQINPTVNLLFRETYSLFDQRTQTPVRTPLNTSGEVQFGDSLKAPFFSQGFTYTKPPPGTPSTLNLTNKLTFYLSKRWYIDAYLSYVALADKNSDYHRFSPTERTIRVVRDLHCWVFRMEFSNRTDRTEASFYIDLKTNLTGQNNLFRDTNTAAYRESGTDISEIFPQDATQPKP